MVEEYNSRRSFYTLIARTEIVESTKIVAVEVVNKMIPKIFRFDDCWGMG